MIKTILCAFSLLALSTNCLANIHRDKFYLGMDVQGVKLSPESLKEPDDNRPASSVFVGYRFDKVGLELGATAVAKANYDIVYKSNGRSYFGNGSVKAANVYLDGLFFHPLAEKLELKGLLGVGALFTESQFALKRNGTIIYSENEDSTNVGLRLGLGFQYNFCEHWNSSVMYKYQLTGSSYSNMQVLALGIAYVF